MMAAMMRQVTNVAIPAVMATIFTVGSVSVLVSIGGCSGVNTRQTTKNVFSKHLIESIHLI